jgi:hypothetical protein
MNSLFGKAAAIGGRMLERGTRGHRAVFSAAGIRGRRCSSAELVACVAQPPSITHRRLDRVSIS